MSTNHSNLNLGFFYHFLLFYILNMGLINILWHPWDYLSAGTKTATAKAVVTAQNQSLPIKKNFNLICRRKSGSLKPTKIIK